MKSTNLQSPTPVHSFKSGNWLTEQLSGMTVLSYSYNADAQLVKMVDLTGTTTYAYDAQDRLLSVSGPWANSTVRYGYDNYSRVTSRAVGSATQSFVYDSLGRLSSENNPLGTFEYTYETANNGRVTQVNYPNGMMLKLSYLPVSQEKRLGEIRYEAAGTQLISRHAYSYSPAGNIKSWTQQSGTDAPKVYQFGYDQIDQLVTALQTQNNSTVNDYAYRYDLAGNRTQEQINGQPQQAIYNQLNQLIAASAGGKMRFAGQTNKETWVSVSGQPAKKLPDNKFEAWVDVHTGVNQIDIVAVDANKNQRTNTYQVTVPASTPQMLSYDADGNLLEDGTRKFTWNAKNQLTKIQYLDGTGTTEFMYDGVGRRTKIIEKNGAGAIQSETRYLWADSNQPSEERDASNSVLKRYYGYGEQVVSATSPNHKLYYTKDHLGSIRELINTNTQILASYDYAPYGKRTKLNGSLDTVVAYTGHHQHARSNLYLTWYRQYDSQLGRWLSSDPIEEEGGVNLYEYADNSTINHSDTLGLRNVNLPARTIPPGNRGPQYNPGARTNIPPRPIESQINPDDLAAVWDESIKRFGGKIPDLGSPEYECLLQKLSYTSPSKCGCCVITKGYQLSETSGGKLWYSVVAFAARYFPKPCNQVNSAERPRLITSIRYFDTTRTDEFSF